MSGRAAMAAGEMIRLDGVGKGYRCYDRPADRLRELLLRRSFHTIHWALRDATFSVGEGETFGIIGENGAGKSTLLKIVAGTLRPTEGILSVRGRVAALLELGAGFHPEESGRENVFIMGALSGIPPRRMAAYYDEIAAFSELPPEVLERPVKTYSSGMFMRLAFATATAVDPDILIVDEALSVGDMHFQKKSLDRIMGFRDRGKTVLFCSHNLYQVRSLCNRAAWLHEGRVRAIGLTEEIVTAYEAHEREKDARHRDTEPAGARFRAMPAAAGLARIVGVTVGDADGNPRDRFATFGGVSVLVEVEADNEAIPWHVGIAIVRNDRENVFGTASHFAGGARPLTAAGRRLVALRFPALPLLSGEYWLSVYVLDDTGLKVYDQAERICPFTVHHAGREFGVVFLPHEWHL